MPPCPEFDGSACRGALHVEAGRHRRAVGEVAEHRLVAALGHEVERREEGAAFVQRGGLEVQLVERLETRGVRQPDAPVHGRKRDARFLVAQDTGSQRCGNVQRIEVPQPAHDHQALTPVESLVPEPPVERNLVELVVAIAIEVVQHDAAELRRGMHRRRSAARPPRSHCARCPTGDRSGRSRSRTRPGRSPRCRSRATCTPAPGDP